MAQRSVQLVSTDDLEQSITIAIDGRRVEYFVAGRYYGLAEHIKGWLRNGWNNYVITQLTHSAATVNFPGAQKERKCNTMSISIDHEKLPSEEYSWTVIAPTARSITYSGERAWFKTQADAESFAASIYEGETKKNFDLAIVQCKNVVAPKPQIELSSRWNTTSSS